MNRRYPLAGRQTLGVAVAAVALGISIVAAQAPTAVRKSPAAIPRMADGHPDLQGNWSNATITPFERLRADAPLVMTEEAARDEETRTQAAVDAREKDAGNPDRDAPPVGGVKNNSPNAEPTYLERVWQAGAGSVGGYNTFWVDPGDKVLRVDGQPRSSILIDPPNGRVPAYTAEAQARIAKAAEARRAAGDQYDHPELRPLAERCITSFGSNAGPPMLPNYFYNNNYTIVQSKDTIIILTEMVHDARVIRMNATHAPSNLRKWFGDSIGHWEGDTLVIETTNFYQMHGYRNSWENLKVTERLSRKDARTLNYRFTVEDPTTFTSPFTGELVFNAMAPGEMVYEYACHEANYGLEGVLSGARAAEREAAKKKPQQ